MKTKVKINYTDNEDRDFNKGEVGFIDGYVRGGNNVPLAAVIIGKRITLVPIHGLDVIKTKI